jgi:hypothetical protein
MRINSLNKLPHKAREFFDTIRKEAEKHVDEITAHKTALELLKTHYEPTPRVGKKSIVVSQHVDTMANGSTSFDIMLGKPTIDVDNQMLKFWQNRPIGVIKGDMEHYYADKADGVYTDIDDRWEGFVPVIQKFWHKGDELWGKVELPENHPMTLDFIKDWKSGKYGVSVEFIAPEEAETNEFIDGQLVSVISEGQITGFSFTENPAISETKISNK